MRRSPIATDPPVLGQRRTAKVAAGSAGVAPPRLERREAVPVTRLVVVFVLAVSFALLQTAAALAESGVIGSVSG